jgi:hypothetical protein
LNSKISQIEIESSMSSIFNDADGTCELEKPETKEWN